MASAAPTITFFGSHPLRAHVPPNGLESTIATFHPASRQRDVAAEAADPVPIAIKGSSSWPNLVRTRHQLVWNFRTPDALPCMGREGAEAQP
jgi:hypothetical protein